MALSFADLRNNRANNFNKLNSELKKLNNKFEEDKRFWQPTVDNAGNGFAIIRFLPEPVDEDLPYIRYYQYSFKGPTGLWFIEKSPTTLGLPSPVTELNSILWNSKDDMKIKQARSQKRKLYFVSNIYVVRDTGNPENEGKVFLFRFGKKLFDKINERMEPQFEDEKPLNPFDLWEGANFKLKIRKVEGYRNYDKSEFDSPSPLFTDEKKLEQVWKSEYPLKEFVDPSTFKSYKDLSDRLARVLNVPNPLVQSNRVDNDQETGSTHGEIRPKSQSSVDDDLDDDLANLETLELDDEIPF